MKENDYPQTIRIPETDSTNNYLRTLLQLKKLPEATMVVAGYQTRGRGQTGNSWESAPEQNLLFSILLYPKWIPANKQFIISQITALSVAETLRIYTPDITIKWPNDIYWKEKKIAGILIENDLSGPTIYCSILGIGININQEEFHSDAPNPVSLYQITGKKQDPEVIREKFMVRLLQYYIDLLKEKEEEIRQQYMHNLFRRTGFHLFQKKEKIFEARIHSIEPTGHLILEDHAGHQTRYAFKEISFILNNDK